MDSNVVNGAAVRTVDPVSGGGGGTDVHLSSC